MVSNRSGSPQVRWRMCKLDYLARDVECSTTLDRGQCPRAATFVGPFLRAHEWLRLGGAMPISTPTISSTIITDSGEVPTIGFGGFTKDNTLGLSGTMDDPNIASVDIYDGAT